MGKKRALKIKPHLYQTVEFSLELQSFLPYFSICTQYKSLSFNSHGIFSLLKLLKLCGSFGNTFYNDLILCIYFFNFWGLHLMKLSSNPLPELKHYWFVLWKPGRVSTTESSFVWKTHLWHVCTYKINFSP